jgi:sugar phosphate isomerase/epimerase
MPRLSVSTWSLHRALGPRYHLAKDGSGRLVPHDDTPGELSLLELPAQIAARGIKTLEICHFHFPRLDGDYIADLRTVLQEAEVELFSILIDAGDITHPDPAKRAQELEWIRSWLAVAGSCGAGHARVIAGYADITLNGANPRDHEVICLSAENLRALAQFGHERGVRVITENFHPLTKRPECLLAILELCEDEVGLCVDFGNYKGPTKYVDLSAILPHADSIHAKARYPQAGEIDRDDFIRCLDLAKGAGFAGPYSLIFDDAGDEWPGLSEMGRIIEPYVTTSKC